MYMPANAKNTYAIIKFFKHNSNTAKHGFGDYPETVEKRVAIVDADTPIKAKNIYGKVMRPISTGGRFPNGKVIDIKDYDAACIKEYGELPEYI